MGRNTLTDKEKLPEEEVVVMNKSRYEQLLRDEHFLICLEGWGVDNWNGYDEAKSQFNKEYEEEE